MTKAQALRRPALRYFGGKWRLGPWIISHFPSHMTYVEPFSGSCSVLLQKPKSEIEVVNDLDREVIEFFRTLREHPDGLIRAINLTPFSRAELELSYQSIESLPGRTPVDDAIERARRFYVRIWQAWMPRTHTKTGWRHERLGRSWKTTVENWNDTAHLWQAVERLKDVQFDCDDALTVVRRFDSVDTLFYVDPPYVGTTRCERWSTQAYRFDLDEAYHQKLGEMLNSIKGMAILSGYPSELYKKLYPGWKRYSHAIRTMSRYDKTDHLWVSPRAHDQARQYNLNMEMP